MRIVITGGGTGGHIYPGLAIARSWEKKAELVFLGHKDKLEGQVVPEAGFKLIPIDVSPIPRKNLLGLVRAGGNALRGTWQSWSFLRKFRPDLIIGTGGFVAGPPLLAAFFLRIPIILHEQNAYPSLTNRIMARKARVVCISMPPARNHLQRSRELLVTGNPVRPEILEYDREKARQELELEEKDRMLLIMGGSQGARSINKAVVNWVKEADLPSNWRIYHATGRDNFSQVEQSYREEEIRTGEGSQIRLKAYIENVGQVLAAADLFVGRSGATTVAEIMARDLPAVLIPYPHAAEDHQKANARFLQEKGSAIILPDAELDAGKLGGMVEELLNDHNQLEKMRKNSSALQQPNALDQISEVMERVLGEGR